MQYKLYFKREKFKPVSLSDHQVIKVREFLKDDKAKFIDIGERTISKYDIDYIDTDKKKKEEKVWICDCGKRNPMSVWPASECGCDRNEYLKQLQLNINPQ